MMRLPTARPVAFFDVDETLISKKSMFAFLKFWLLAGGSPPAEAAGQVGEVRATLAGVDRLTANRRFYRQFAGARWSSMLSAGHAWFAEEQQRGGLFHSDVLAAVRDHQRSDHLVVFVSGSFRPCLNPIADFCAADIVECSELVVVDDVVTGELVRPMIGQEKRAAVFRHAPAARIRDLSYAYGDHASDLDMLLAVGSPVAVGGDAGLDALATEHAWPRLAGVAGP